MVGLIAAICVFSLEDTHTRYGGCLVSDSAPKVGKGPTTCPQYPLCFAVLRGAASISFQHSQGILGRVEDEISICQKRLFSSVQS
jgi:hypothetical protein